jgi:hypothetical protein
MTETKATYGADDELESAGWYDNPGRYIEETLGLKATRDLAKALQVLIAGGGSGFISAILKDKRAIKTKLEVDVYTVPREY